jgi:tetratricopeptide (TPR) repeat protein
MYREAIRINPLYFKAYHNWGNLLVREGKLEEASANYLRALSIDPEYAQSHRNLGVVLNRLGRTAEGNRHLEEASRLTEENGGAPGN